MQKRLCHIFDCFMFAVTAVSEAGEARLRGEQYGEGTPIQAAWKVPVHLVSKYRWEVTGLGYLVLMRPRAESYERSIAFRVIKVML